MLNYHGLSFYFCHKDISPITPTIKENIMKVNRSHYTLVAFENKPKYHSTVALWFITPHFVKARSYHCLFYRCFSQQCFK